MPENDKVLEGAGLGPCPGCGLSACLRLEGIASGRVGIVFDYSGRPAFVDRSRVVDHPVEGAQVECAHCRMIRPDLVYRAGRIERRSNG